MKKKLDQDMEKYKDILYEPHHVSRKRPQMSLADRAAQFSPFAAVVGHEAAIRETARRTDRKKELDEMEKAIIDAQLREIEALLPDGPDVEIEYFQPDERKAGGKYLTKVGKVKKFDTYLRQVLMMDGTRIDIDQIARIGDPPLDQEEDI
jgi:hypothetical protein